MHTQCHVELLIDQSGKMDIATHLGKVFVLNIEMNKCVSIGFLIQAYSNLFIFISLLLTSLSSLFY